MSFLHGFPIRRLMRAGYSSTDGVNNPTIGLYNNSQSAEVLVLLYFTFQSENNNPVFEYIVQGAQGLTANAAFPVVTGEAPMAGQIMTGINLGAGSQTGWWNVTSPTSFQPWTSAIPYCVLQPNWMIYWTQQHGGAVLSMNFVWACVHPQLVFRDNWEQANLALLANGQ